VLIDLDGGGVVAVLPERALLPFALVVFLGSATGNQLHALGNDVRACVFNQKMNVIGCDHVIEH